MAKSPFAAKKSQTYRYPEPWDPEDKDDMVRIDSEVMDEDADRPYITLRVPNSRKDVDAVADYTQAMVVAGENGDGTRFSQNIASANRGVFTLLVESWSFDAVPNSANYDRLDQWSGEWITACVADVVRMGTTRDFPKEQNSSKSPEISESEQSPQPQEASI